MRLCALFICFALAACAEFPELETHETATAVAADYPVLIPIEPASTTSTEVTPIVGADALRASADALRNR